MRAAVIAEDSLPTDRAGRFAGVVRTILESNVATVDPWITREGQWATPGGAAKQGRHRDDLLAFADITNLHGVRILEPGCGYGFGLLWYAARGAIATGLEIYEPMVAAMAAYAAVLPIEWRDRFDVTRGNASHMPYEDASFDVVVSNEAISHYHDLAAFVAEAHRVLRPGGVLVVADANNALYPPTRRRNHRWFHEVEYGPTSGEGIFTKPFLEKRRELLIKHRQLDAETAGVIAAGTYGMDAEETLAAADAYLRRGDVPTSTFTTTKPPVDPESGQAIERLIHPYAFARELRRAGFGRVRVHGYWGGAGGRRLVRWANEILSRVSRVTIATTTFFRIAAWR